jgi:hypothetical protein
MQPLERRVLMSVTGSNLVAGDFTGARTAITGPSDFSPATTTEGIGLTTLEGTDAAAVRRRNLVTLLSQDCDRPA